MRTYATASAERLEWRECARLEQLHWTCARGEPRVVLRPEIDASHASNVRFRRDSRAVPRSAGTGADATLHGERLESCAWGATAAARPAGKAAKPGWRHPKC
jgi:hypothetical protein